ncbi:AAA family ATPase [Kribbella sp. NPDC058245]|uniref:AAA family ATPase n=1 Tax=Kribbella sp. NPDC058245 TaxID=3346399 RepID=UPI0036E48898
MADIKSATGEGPEPQVPGRDQPAQELANLIAQSEAGAKGKGFWRRRRRKNATPEPVAAPPVEAEADAKPAEPAEDKSPEAAESAVDASASAAETASDESVSDESTSTEGAESADDGAAKAAESADVAAEETEKSVGAATDAPADAAADADAPESDAATDSADEDDESSSVAGAEAAEGDVAGATKSEADDEAKATDEAQADDTAAAEEPEEAEEPPRLTVGVVYEPDESPDGFPLEYGNIIVGLPKQGEGSSDDIDEARAYAEELRAVQSAGVESIQVEPADDEVEDESETPAAEETDEAAAEAAGDDVADEPTETVGTDEAEAEAEAEAATDEAAPATDEEAEAAVADDAETTEVVAEETAEHAAAEETAPEAEQTADDAEPEAEPEAAVAEEQTEADEQTEGEEPADKVVGDEPAEAVADEPGDDAAEESGEEVAEVAGEDSSDESAEATAEQASEDSAEGESAEAEGSGDEVVEEPAEVELTAEELAERLAAEQAAMALITALMKLRGALAGSRLPLDVVGADEARQQQKAMLDQLDDYILPRLVQLEAPILAVVGGSTGAGKSTLVNSVIGKVVSEPGVLRPTTRSPVLIHHPADADWFIGDRVLPGMARTTAESPGGMEDPGQLRLVASDTVPRGLAVLDAPDIDSVVEANRDLATQLLAAADLWLFVTTAARYSDAVPWEFLQSASDRSTAVAVVLDRAPAETIDDITGHLAQMLLERGLGDSPLFSIKETVVDGNGMLPDESVASIKDWLVDLAADAEARVAVVRRTLHGAVTSMVKTTPPFAAAVRAQGDTAIELRSSVEAAYDQAVKDIANSTQDASLLRGEVLARWQEFVGTGELLKGLQGNSNKVRDKVKKSVAAAGPAPTRDLNDAIESGLSSLLIEQAAAAAERAEKIWQATPAGRQLLAAAKSAPGADDESEAPAATDTDIVLGAMSPEFAANAERAVREWQTGVLELVRKVGTEKRLAARILDAGVNGLSLSVMVVLFAENAGIPTGAEASIGVGSAVVGQKLLTAVFGDAAVQTLMSKSRADLDGKVHALMDAEFARYLAVLDQHPVDPEAARQLTEAARAVEDCT